MSESGAVVSVLTNDCGHHCGAVQPDQGGSVSLIVGHCSCPEYHGTRPYCSAAEHEACSLTGIDSSSVCDRACAVYRAEREGG